MRDRIVYFKFQKLIVYGVLSTLAAQLIYFPSNYGYAHIILYILFLLNMDIYKPEYRKVNIEITTTILTVVIAIILMLSKFLGDSSAYIYYLLLIGFSILNIHSSLNFKKAFVNRELDKINDRNINMFEKNSKFLIIYSYLVILILIGIIGQSIYSIVTL